MLLSYLLAAAPEVVDHLLPWDADRQALTLAYLNAHRTTPLTGDPEADVRMTPKVVILHWTGGPTASSAWNTFAAPRLAGRPELQDAGALNVGAHYLVDRDGRIERLAPEDRVVRHCIGLNHVAIGIENVGGGEQWPLTEAQVAANVALVESIASRWSIERVIGHSEYRTLEGTPLFEEKDPTYRTTKPDPGPEFMKQVRARLPEALRGG